MNKAPGIKFIAVRLGVDIEQALAVGDIFSDVLMLSPARVGIAMGNAPEPVKVVADEVTGTIGEGGIRAAFARHRLR